MDSSRSPKLWISQRTTNLTLKDNRPQPRDFLVSLCFQNTRRPLRTCGEGREAYCRPTVFLAACAWPSSTRRCWGSAASPPGIGGSALSVPAALWALSGLMGTILSTSLRGRYGSIAMGIISSWLHISCWCSACFPPLLLEVLLTWLFSYSH